MENIIESSGLSKRYKDFKALSGLSIHVPKGAIYGLVGKNGAGKTTLIRILCGLQQPTEGVYSLYGTPSDGSKISNVRRRVGAVVETPSVYLDMSAEDNLKQQFVVMGLPSFKPIPELLSLVGLGNTGNKKAGNFSLGMRQRLGIAIALAGDPDLLILDEPINGLDPEGIVEIRELILKLNREKQITFFISSHILDELSRLATHFGFIDGGRMVKEISASQLNDACRKCLRVRVSDIRALCRVLEQMGLEYSVLGNSRADIFGQVDITDLTITLNNENCHVLSMAERDETLESFYMSLLGGERHE